MIDTIHSVHTPEGIDLHLRTAGMLPRSMAWLIDGLIRSVIYVAISLAFLPFGGIGTGLLLLVTFFVEWFYPVLFEVLRDGSTPGKSIYDIKVIHDDGTPIGWNASLIRNLLRIVDFLPVMYGFGIISMMLNSDFKRLGDLAAGTLVVYKEATSQNIDMINTPVVRPNRPLKLEEQQAIIAFAHRSQNLTDERAHELALLTGPLIENEPDPVATLKGMAAWLSGEQRS